MQTPLGKAQLSPGKLIIFRNYGMFSALVTCDSTGIFSEKQALFFFSIIYVDSCLLHKSYFLFQRQKEEMKMLSVAPDISVSYLGLQSQDKCKTNFIGTLS